MTTVPVHTERLPTARPLAGAVSVAEASVAAPSPEVLRELELAQARSGKIRKAVSVALFNGWTAGIFAALSLPFAFSSLVALLMSAILTIVAYNEFAGAKGLKRFDERAARKLGCNQIGFGLTLVFYALWSMYSTLTTPNEFQATLAQAGQAAAMFGSIDQLYRNITLATYGGLILGSLIFQGGTAWYYFSRMRHIRAYVRETPAWLLDHQRLL